MPQKNQQFKIRDLRNGDWYWIHKLIYEEYAEKIGAMGLALYNAYAYYANGGKCFPSQKTIADRLSISKRSIQRLNRKLEENGLIKVESGKRTGKSNVVYLLKIQKGCDRESQGCDTLTHPTAKESRTNNNKLTINTLLQERGKKSFGNQDINFLISYLKEKMQLKKLDGSQKENRRYCWLCLKKFGKTKTVRKLIEIAANSNFHSQNLTSFKYLYNHGVKIANELRQRQNKIAIIK